MARRLGIDEKELAKMTPEELIQYFLDRLKEQTEAHHGGNNWIGTGGTSPVGHSGTTRRDAGGRRLPEQIGRQGGHGAALQGLLARTAP